MQKDVLARLLREACDTTGFRGVELPLEVAQEFVRRAVAESEWAPPQSSIARVAYEQVTAGNPVPDDVLEEALGFFRTLESNLRQVGPVFQLAANEAGRVYEVLYGFWACRKREALYNQKESNG